MQQLWLVAWGFSLAASLLVLTILRRSGLSKGATAILSLCAFVSPLFAAISGAASFVYTQDIVTPLAIWLAILRWRFAPPKAKLIGCSLAVGVGVAPLFPAALFADARGDLLFAIVNAYRSVGVGAMVIVMSAEQRREKSEEAFVAVFSLLALIIGAATLAQATGIAPSNVLYTSSLSGLYGVSTSRYAALGLWRNPLGIIGAFGIAALLSSGRTKPLSWCFAVLGGVAGCAAILLAGSKTFLVCALAIAAAWTGVLLLFRQFDGRWRIIGTVASLCAVGTALWATNASVALQDQTIAQTVMVLTMRRQSLSTLESREDRWHDTLAEIGDDPGMLVGVPERHAPRNLHYYHNEYVATLGTGGLLSTAFYVLALGVLFHFLLSRRDWRSRVWRFAVLTLLVGLIAGTTGEHLIAGTNCVPTAFLFAAVYGFALAGIQQTQAQESSGQRRRFPAPLVTGEGRHV